MGQVIDPNALLIRTDKQPATVQFLNNLVSQFCFAINGIGVRMDGYDVAEQNLINLGLANINSVLGPFLSTLQEAAQLGFLVGEADGQTNSLVVGQQFDMALSNSGAELFTPTQWMTMMDVNDNTNWGICRLISWVQQDANLSTMCIYATKTQTSNSWQVACNAGIFPATVNSMNNAVTSATNAANSASAAAASAASVAGLAGAIAAGPVVSVAGRSGPVTLGEIDIAGLVADLAARPTISTVNSQVSGLQPHSATLDALAALTYSSFIIAFLGAANAVAALTTLGAAPLASPTFTGTPAAPTPTAGDNSTKIATTAFLANYALTSALPAKASSATVLAGTDDTQFATSLGIAANYVSKSLVVNPQVGTSYTLQASDNGKLITLTNSAAITLTCPNSLAATFNCAISQEGAGQVTVVAQSGGTLASRGSRFKLNGQYAMGFLRVASNSGTNAAWRLGGDLSA